MAVVWYRDEELTIKFDEVPDVEMRKILPWHTEAEVKEILKKPFINNKALNVAIIDEIEQITYEFVIPENYVWDGASIPRVFWRLIGAKTSPEFLIPSLIHDVLCENHDYIDDDRYLSTIILERLLAVSRVNALKRWTVKHSVDNYQKVFGGW